MAFDWVQIGQSSPWVCDDANVVTVVLRTNVTPDSTVLPVNEFTAKVISRSLLTITVRAALLLLTWWCNRDRTLLPFISLRHSLKSPVSAWRITYLGVCVLCSIPKVSSVGPCDPASKGQKRKVMAVLSSLVCVPDASSNSATTRRPSGPSPCSAICWSTTFSRLLPSRASSVTSTVAKSCAAVTTRRRQNHQLVSRRRDTTVWTAWVYGSHHELKIPSPSAEIQPKCVQ